MQDAAAHWNAGSVGGFNSLTDLGGEILGITTECCTTFDVISRETYDLMEAEKALITAAEIGLVQAETKKTELNDLGKKAKGDPNDPGMLELMKRYGFHEASSVSGGIIFEKKTAQVQVRVARKSLVDALQQAVVVNIDSINRTNALLQSFQHTANTVSGLSTEAAARYRAKEQHMVASQTRIAGKKAEFEQQAEEVDRERQVVANHYVKRMKQWKCDSEEHLLTVRNLLAEIEENEQDMCDATREDQESAWKAQLLKGTLAENGRVLDACNDEIEHAPEQLDRCVQVVAEMGATGAKLIGAVAGNVTKDVLRRESSGRDFDAQHLEEHCVARKSVFSEKINTDIKKFNCKRAIQDAEDEMGDAAELGDEDVYGEADEKRAKKQDQLNLHEQTLTGLQVEIDALDELIAKVVDRFKSLYTDPSLQEPGTEQRARVESTGVTALWTRGHPRAAWNRVLPAGKLESAVIRVAGGQMSRRERAVDERQDAAKLAAAEFKGRMMGELCDHSGGGGSGS